MTEPMVCATCGSADPKSPTGVWHPQRLDGCRDAFHDTPAIKPTYYVPLEPSQVDGLPEVMSPDEYPLYLEALDD